MKFATTAALATALLGAANASIGYGFYDQQNRQGNNIEGSIDINRCTPMPNGWNDRVRSFLIANGNAFQIRLTFFNDGNCRGTSKLYTIGPTQFFTQDSLPAGFDRKWSSFRYD